MKAKAWRLYGAADARLEDIELEGAGEEGIVVELVTNTICQGHVPRNGTQTRAA